MFQKKGVGTRILAASPPVTALPSNLTRLYYNGSAAKSHSTTTQTASYAGYFCSGIKNLLFDGLAYHKSGHFAHCSLLIATTQLAKHPHVLYAKPSNKVYLLS